MTDYVTVKVLSQKLGVSEQVIRGWLRQNLVPGACRLPNGEYRLPLDAENHLLRPVEEPVARAR
jgi:hypothetical protein